MKNLLNLLKVLLVSTTTFAFLIYFNCALGQAVDDDPGQTENICDSALMHIQKLNKHTLARNQEGVYVHINSNNINVPWIESMYDGEKWQAHGDSWIIDGCDYEKKTEININFVNYYYEINIRLAKDGDIGIEYVILRYRLPIGEYRSNVPAGARTMLYLGIGA